MDNQKLILFLALSIVVLLLWQAWQEEFGQPVKPVSHEPAPSTGTMPSTSPSAETPTMGPSATKPSEAPSVSQEVTKTGQRIHVVTDVLDAEITSVGGDLRKVDLIRYPVSINKPDEPYPLLEDTQAKLFIAQTGLLSQKNSAPDHYAVFTPEATEYHLQQGKDDIVVRLNWTGPDGLNVGKIYTFHRNSYIVNLDIQVNNTTDKDWSGSMYRQLQRNKASEPGQSRFIYTYTGAVVSTPYNKYEKIKFDNMADWKPKDSYIKGGWEAMVQHYFVASILPEQNQLNHFYTKVVDNIRYIIGMTTEARTVAPGSTENFSTQFYIGPKDQHRMENAAPNLQLTVDYGIFTVISQPLSWLLENIHKVVRNWGWSIILLTMLIKLVFYKLSETSYRSMANMRKFQPKIAAIRERYGDDRQRMSQAMMELYKKEKINPLGGCLPMVVQIPVFISLYWVIVESVELRQAPFVLWIHDLSTQDPYYVLPVLMGATMLLQQRLNPAQVDPVHQRVMMILPFVFTAFFAFFPSGLVLYWVVNNLLSLIQQWYITHKIEKASN